MPGLRRSRAARYAAAVVAVGLALLLQMLLVPLFGGDPNLSPFMVFFAAVMVAAWFGGLGPGLFSVGLAALLSWYFFLSPQESFAINTLGQGVRLVVFVVEGVVISSLVEALHSARRRAEAALEARSQGEERFRLLVENARRRAQLPTFCTRGRPAGGARGGAEAGKGRGQGRGRALARAQGRVSLLGQRLCETHPGRGAEEFARLRKGDARHHGA